MMPSIDLKKAELKFRDGTSPIPRTIEIKIGEGNLTYAETRNIEYLLDQGRLDLTRDGDQEPVEVSLDFVWEFLRSQIGDLIPTPEEVLKQIGLASVWETTGPECEPYAVDVIIEYDPQCVGIETETIELLDFRYESLDYDIRSGSVSCSGKCNITEPTVTRGVTPTTELDVCDCDAIITQPIAPTAILSPIDVTGRFQAVYTSDLFSTGVSGCTIDKDPLFPPPPSIVVTPTTDVVDANILVDDPVIILNSVLYDGIYEINQKDAPGGYYRYHITSSGSSNDTGDIIFGKFLFGIEPSQSEQIISVVANNVVRYSPSSPINPYNEIFKGAIDVEQDDVSYAREIIASNPFKGAGLYFIKITNVYWFIVGGGHQASPSPATCRAIVDVIILSREQYAVHHGNPWA